jgi:hypothetical protein
MTKARKHGVARGSVSKLKSADRIRRSVEKALPTAMWNAEPLEPRVLLTTALPLAGPILDLRFNQAPAYGEQSVADSSGNTNGSFYATDNGHTDITNNGGPTVVAGPNANTGSAWSFARTPTTTPAEVDIPNQGLIPNMGNITSTTGLTMGFWVNNLFQASDAGVTLINSGSVDVSAVAATSGSNTVGQIKIGLGGSQFTTQTSLPNGVLDGNWHYIVISADFTHSTSNVHLYVDGALDPTNGTSSHTFSNFSDTYTSGNDLWIFSDRNQANHWIGAADNISIYTRAISAAEVSELYANGDDAAPNLFPGPVKTIPVGIATALGGAVYNQGNADHTTLSSSWSVVSGPGTVTFTNATQPNTTATFSQTGTYVLQLTSTDGLYTNSGTVTETVVANTAPVVTTTSTMPAIVLPTTSLSIGGTATDDGLPYGTLKTTWSLLTAPATGGSVSFANASAINTTATFTAAGRYVLELTASDGQLSTSSQLPIEVYPAGTGGSQIVVDAGGTHEAWTDAPTVNLAGSYWNTNNAVRATWSVAQSPSGGTVSFGSPSSLNSTAKFNEAGVYVLKLSVTDGTLSGSDTSVVQVYSTAQNFSDSLGFLNQYFNTNTNTNNNLDLTYDFTGFNWSGFSSPGAAYSHPRILLSASDIPNLVSRLQNTTAGEIEFATIEQSVANNLTNANATYASIYSDLANGTATSFVTAGRPYALVAALSYDAFEQMVLYAEATSGSAAQTAALTEGQKIGAALATIGTDSAAQIALDNNADWQNSNINYTYRDQFAFAYDYDYNFMTSAEQNTARNAIITAINGQWSIGEDTLPTYESNSSNWIPMIDSALLMNICAVEGETSTDSNNVQHVSDPTNFPRDEAALQKWFALGLFPDGEMYEGMGKGQIYAQSLVALAKRGDYLIAATSARYNIQQLYSASMEPYGYTYTWDEYLGGSDMAAKDADTEVLAYAFPNDSAIDFQLRNALGPSYSNVNSGSGLPDLGFGVISDQLLIEASLVTDYNKSLSYAAAQSAAGTEVGLNYFSNNRGVLIARSDNTANAAQIYFQPRSEPGGHSIPDRNTFTYSALGENWVPYTGILSDPTQASIVTVDGQGPSVMPAAVTNVSQSANAVFATGNATQAYSTGQGGTSTPAQWNYNEFQLTPDDPSWGNLPVAQLPGWDTNGQTSGVTWAEGTQYVAAYRTAGLVRGNDPYALITDSIQKDQSTHAYTWQMDINDNVTWTINPPTSASPFYDVILHDPAAGTNLLVRFLSYSGSTPTVAVSGTKGAFTFNYKELTFTTNSVAPNFKVLVSAFKDGTPLPTTTWNANNTVLSVSYADGQSDQITYGSSDPNNPTATTLNRLSSGGVAQSVPSVTVAATVANTAEGSSTPGTFTVTRTGSTTSALTVRYGVGGTAVAGTDYTALSGTVTIPAGSSSATVSVAPLSATTTATSATVIITLVPLNTYSVPGQTAATGSSATVTVSAATTPTTLGTFTSTDIGSPGAAGSASLSGELFTVKGGGDGLGVLPAGSTTTSSDQFQFYNQTLTGDAAITARVDAESDSNNSGRAGIMFRNDVTDAAAVFAYVGVDQNGTARFSYRTTEGATVSSSTISAGLPALVELVRSGSNDDQFSAYYSLDGVAWYQLGSTQTITMATPAYAGLAVTADASSSTATTLATATLDDVTVNGNGLNATPTVSIAADGNATQGSPAVSGDFLVTRDNALGALPVSYTIGAGSGAAINGTDYASISGTVVIPNGQFAALVPITPIGTASAGTSKSVSLTLAASTASPAAYTVGTSNNASLTITEAGTKNDGLAPVLWYGLNQTPKTGTGGVVDYTGNTSGTLSSSTLPSVVSGPTSAQPGAWNFGTTGTNVSTSGTSTNNQLNSLGNVNRTTGLTIAFWENESYIWNSYNGNDILSFGKTFTVQSTQDSTSHVYTYFTFGPYNARVINTLDGNWHMVVLSLDFTSSIDNAAVFLDGHQQTVGWPYNNLPSNSIHFTSFNDPGNPNFEISPSFKGVLSDVMVFNKPLNLQQIQQLYNSSDRPTATLSVGSQPVSGSVPSASITFDRNVQGLSLSNLSLTRDGTAVSLSGATLSPNSTTSTTSYTLSNLSSLTTTQGNYVLTLTPTSSVVDQNNVVMLQSETVSWTNDSAPSSLAATATGPNDIHLTWTNTSTDSSKPSIAVLRSPDGVSNWQIVNTVAGGTTSYDDTTVSDGVQYYYEVEAVSGSNYSAPSNVVSIAAPLITPTIAAAAQVANVLSNKITWIDNTGNATSITVDRSTNNGSSWTNVAAYSGTAAQYVDTNVQVGKTYLYRIQALNSVAKSSYLVTSSITDVAPVAPTVATPATAAALVTTLSTPLTVLGADLGGESNLTYTWATTGTPPAAVTFTDNNDNTAKNTTAQFTAPGTYNFIVTIKNQAGLTVTSLLSLTVVRSLTSITVAPAASAVAAASTTQFTATGLDQFNQPLATQPGFNWSVTGGGSIDATGLYTAPSTASSVTVQASNGTFNGSTTLTVSPSLGIFTNNADIYTAATLSIPGSASYNTATGVYSVTGAGADIYGNSDQFNYTYKTLNGPGTIVARVTGTQNTNAWFKTGIMFRGSTSPSDVFADVVVSYSSGIVMQYRTSAGGGAGSGGSNTVPAPAWIQLVRSGTAANNYDQFSGYYSTSTAMPTQWTQLGGTITISSFPLSALVGIPVTSHNTAQAGTGTVANVQVISTPIAPATMADQAPVVAVAAAAASPTITAGASDALSVLGLDDQSSPSLTYTWSATPSAGVTFSSNGSAASANTTATFTQPGLTNLLVTIKNADGLSTTSTVNVNVLPTWLSPTSLAIYNASNKTLAVTGPATITADPGTTGPGSNPTITASGPGASIVFTPATGTATDFHIAGLTLTNGATATETSLDPTQVAAGTNSVNHATNHDAIVIAQATGNTNLNVAGGLLDLVDNDLIYHYDPNAGGTGLGGASALAAIQGQVANAFDTTNQNWDGTSGITSSAAAIQANNFSGATGLGVIDNTDPNGNQYTSFDQETFSDTNEILVKYTYNGDSLLEGTVNNDGLLAFEQGRQNTDNHILGNTWLLGNYDFSADGAIGNNELLYFEGGYAACQAGAPTL